MTNSFVHLHVHSEYSLLDGAARIEDLVRRAADLGMKALALTDHGVMYGVVPFYKACRNYGIKPIIGCEMYYTAGSLSDKGNRQDQPIYHLILLARNQTGYENLMKLCSIAHLEGFHYKPRIDGKRLKQYSEGLICLSSCLAGEVSRHLLQEKTEEARQAALRYRDIFGEYFYLELQDHGLLEQKKVNQAMIELSRDTGIPLIVTNDVHYLAPVDQTMQDILICIGTGKTVDQPDRLKFTTDQPYLKSPEEMRALFAHRQDALDNTLKVAELCNLELEFGRSILPQFRPIPDGLTAGEYLDALCREGLERRYAGTPRWEDVEGRQALTERLEYELGVIGTMGYSDYFLIVWDFIRFAHEQGIATGPGRGSSAGSLVAYVLEITDVDPIHYGLLFERFLNPERVSMPDIDIDFDDERRDEVIRYVMHKYGEDHVAQIITFGTMAARAAVRDVGRVMNVPYNEVDRAAKMISGHLTLPETLAENKELAALADKFPRTKEMLQMAMRVEGFPRHVSTHAAGVVISREPLTRYVPLQAGAEGGALTQYSMENLESIGLLKMDFLGLRTLSILGRTLRWIEESTGERVDLRRLPLDDPLTYEMLCRGETAGIFQFDAAYMRRVLKELQPSQFEDMISLNALNRPGPIEFIPKYIAAKHGEIAVEYPHPVLEPILRDTYGIIVYQEQIMQIAALMAGFSLGEADLLRRAVSKKKREVLDEERAHFVRGSLKQGYGEADANKVYDMIVRFADYGFPRAHATAYALVAFQTAYLKAHYPMEFMAAMLTAWMGSQRKTAEYVDECRHMKIAVLPPDVNESGVAFTPVRAREETGDDVAGAIRFGLAAIKNVGTQAIEAIMREREGKPFADLADFCRRVDLRVCNKRVIESLIMGGAMDAFPGHRAQLLAVLERQIESALKWRKEREDLQLHLFGFTEEVNWTIEYPEVTPFTRMQQLTMERELLGMFISGHPLDEYEGLLQELGTEPLHQLAEAADNSEVVTAGMVVSFKTFLTKKGQTMAYVELEDRVDKVEVVMFPDCWKQYGSMVAKERLLLVQGRIQQQDEAVKLLAGRVAPLDEPGAREAVLHWRRSARREPVQRNTASPSQNAAVRASASPTASNATARPAATAPGRRPAESSPRDTDAATSASAAAAKPRQPREAAAPAPQAEPRLAAASASRQRVFVKIGAARENEQALSSLQQLLKQHPGALDVILFYERDQRTLRLSDQYRIKPSPQLFQDIETLLGPQTVRVK